MEKSGFSKAQMARELGVSNAHVANWLAGQLPRAEQLLTISRYFKVTMEWLISGDGSPPDQPMRALESSHLKQAKTEAEKLVRLLGEAEETAKRLRVFLG